VREGLTAGGMSPDVIEVVADEIAAVDRLVAMLEDHDIGVVLADDVPGVLDHLQRRAQPAAVQ
jgi:hypothetical protein